MILLKILLFLSIGIIVLVPALVFLFVLFIEFIMRIFIKIFKHSKPIPSYFGPILDSDFRRSFQSPRVIIQRSGIKPGMKVLEIGCGSGAYTTFVARAVGPEGKVYALDIQADMIKQLERKLSKPEYQDIKNVELIQKSAYYLPFDDGYIDLIFMVSVLQQIPDKIRALIEAKRVLKPGGILSITEIIVDPYYPIPSKTIKLGIKAGFLLDRFSGNFLHYTVCFKKP